MKEHLVKDKVATVWVNQVMYPGVITNLNDEYVFMNSIQHKGLKYVVKLSSITALSVDENTDTLEKLEAQKKAFEEQQKKAAEEMRAEAKRLAEAN